MKNLERDKGLVADLLDTIRLIKGYVPTTKDELMRDILKQDAILMRLQLTGELMRCQSDSMRERYPDLPWKQAVGLRNIIAHEYGAVDLERVWNLLQPGGDFYRFAARIEEIAQELGVE